MLSRLSVLVVYLVAGLAASAVATPMIGQSSGHGDGMQPSRHNYAQKQPYDEGHYQHKQGHSTKACNVGKQYCCDTVNKASEMETGNLLSIFSAPSIFGVDALIGKNCDPFFAFGGGKCEAKPVCCSETSADGLLAAGCQNLDLDLN